METLTPILFFHPKNWTAGNVMYLSTWLGLPGKSKIPIKSSVKASQGFFWKRGI